MGIWLACEPKRPSVARWLIEGSVSGPFIVQDARQPLYQKRYAPDSSIGVDFRVRFR